ncbi:uncharacterized protein LOC6578081 [Drosophila mojavensis]|uniref:Uncharacterized protein n=1 Tax=Drosophila mojavensis TaxID=7230 RepID=B4KIE8_DROMO|nr:uncharacterized protein LOC6578081 [Drosophila mojavensis]EDW13445.1 uncharacterized protein Dmoj_GI18214 [Drosophila mojavensis]
MSDVRKSHSRKTSSRTNPNSNSDFSSNPNSDHFNRPQATDFTTKQHLRLRAGDLRLARIQISLSKLQHEMEQSGKQIAALCQDVKMDKNLDKVLLQ